jgi:hypothetical protein
MEPDPQLPKWVIYLVVPIVAAPLILAVRPLENAHFFIVAGSMCFAAAAGGLWWGDRRGITDGSRAALGCVGALVLFLIYGLWAFVIARRIFG